VSLVAVLVVLEQQGHREILAQEMAVEVVPEMMVLAHREQAVTEEFLVEAAVVLAVPKSHLIRAKAATGVEAR